MCCSLESLGYQSDFQQSIVRGTSVTTAISAVVGVALGVMALYGVISASSALWVHVGLFSVAAIAVGATIFASERVKSKLAITIAVVTLLALPVLFGSLGAFGVIPAHNMLWSSTMMCGAVVLSAFLVSMFSIGKECCDSEDDNW